MLTKHSMHQYNMKCIKNPNLPQKRVGEVAISADAKKAIAKLKEIGIKTVEILPDKRFPEPVKTHSDLQLLHFGNNIIFSHKEQTIKEKELTDFTFIKVNVIPQSFYPNDVRLNCAIIGNKIICNKKTIATEILELAEKLNYKTIYTNQGYTKCSICIVNENAIITDDKSIFTAVGKYFDDVLFISKNSIQLSGYNYGFIGGCCGKIDKDKIAFNGAIESHADYKKVIDFLKRNNVECVELHKDRLVDIGGILPLMEFE